ncbi:MAG: heparinase II/III family protein [Candidatus Xenobiia bacterium LiM19]
MFSKIKKSVRILSSDRDILRYVLYAASHPAMILSSLKESESSNTWESPHVQGITDPDQNLKTELPAINLPLQWKHNSNEFPKQLTIRLATKNLFLGSLRSINWFDTWEDREDEAALHRFSWVLPLILDLANEGLDGNLVWNTIAAAIDDWCAVNSNIASGRESWQSYTVSERAVNWIIAFLSCNSEQIKKQSLREILEKQAHHILNNLEYHGELLTGNHLSNNGRAVYLTGLVLGNSMFIENGRTILTNECQRLFTEPHYLREGSSHYQFLITRNFCEILWFAQKYSDDDMVQKMIPIVSALDEGCKFFLVKEETGKWNLPLIGDISPDCTPEWLLGVPWVSSHLTDKEVPAGNPPSRGWHCFFLETPNTTSNASVNGNRAKSGNEWARIDKDEWTVFSHVNPHDYPIVAGHAHQDTAALSIFYRGQPIIIDCGRVHYIEDNRGQRGRDCWAHSIAIIDDYNPYMYFRKFYPRAFIENSRRKIPKLFVNNSVLSIVHEGFSRIKGVGAYRRNITCKERTVEIQDSIAGEGIHKVTIIFHVLGKLRERDKDIIIESNNLIFTLTSPSDVMQRILYYGPSRDWKFGWASFQYGHSVDISTVVFSGKLALPWIGLTVVKRELQ